MSFPISSLPASHCDLLRIRGLRYHVRRWGDARLPMLFLGHGWLDVSATFAPLIAPLLDRWQVLAPDWRGFGHTQWPQDGYWFADYLADLHALLAHYSADAPVVLAGHSMGAQIMSVYAGLHPQRARALIVLDGLYMPDSPAETAPDKLRRWMQRWPGETRDRVYPSFEVLARRVRAKHSQLSSEQALFIARCWAAADGYGQIRLLADPKHHLPSAVPYRAAESLAAWRHITAPTLFIDGADSPFRKMLSPEQALERRACFQQRHEISIEGAGHMLHFDAPLPTARAMADFLSDLP